MAINDLRSSLQILGKSFEKEDNNGADLWSWLPSYREAKKHHGEYASEHKPSNADIMAEAACWLAVLQRVARNVAGVSALPRGLNLHEIKEQIGPLGDVDMSDEEGMFECPCGVNPNETGEATEAVDERPLIRDAEGARERRRPLAERLAEEGQPLAGPMAEESDLTDRLCEAARLCPELVMLLREGAERLTCDSIPYTGEGVAYDKRVAAFLAPIEAVPGHFDGFPVDDDDVLHDSAPATEGAGYIGKSVDNFHEIVASSAEDCESS